MLDLQREYTVSFKISLTQLARVPVSIPSEGCNVIVLISLDQSEISNLAGKHPRI